MKKENCFYLGKVVKKYGFRGEVVLKIESDNPQHYKELEFVFLDKDNSLVPFFIKKSSMKNEFLRVVFEGVDSEENADDILKKDIFLPLDLLPKLDENEFYYHEIINFSVYDDEKGFIGKVKNVNDNSPQHLLEIEFSDKEILIPIDDDILYNVDKKKKEIKVNAPNGLIDLYLSE